MSSNVFILVLQRFILLMTHKSYLILLKVGFRLKMLEISCTWNEKYYSNKVQFNQTLKNLENTRKYKRVIMDLSLEMKTKHPKFGTIFTLHMLSHICNRSQKK